MRETSSFENLKAGRYPIDCLTNPVEKVPLSEEQQQQYDQLLVALQSS